MTKSADLAEDYASPSPFSFHLQVMARAGLLVAHQDGRHTNYAANKHARCGSMRVPDGHRVSNGHTDLSRATP